MIKKDLNKKGLNESENSYRLVWMTNLTLIMFCFLKQPLATAILSQPFSLYDIKVAKTSRYTRVFNDW